MLSVKAAGQVYNQVIEFAYIGWNVNHNPDLSMKVDRRIRNIWCSFRKYTLDPTRVPDSLDRMTKKQSHRPPNFLTGHANEDEKY